MPRSLNMNHHEANFSQAACRVLMSTHGTEVTYTRPGHPSQRLTVRKVRAANSTTDTAQRGRETVHRYTLHVLTSADDTDFGGLAEIAIDGRFEIEGRIYAVAQVPDIPVGGEWVFDVEHRGKNTGRITN